MANRYFGGAKQVVTSNTHRREMRAANLAHRMFTSGSDVATDYLSTLLYPGAVNGVKIPDFCLYDTTTAVTVREGTMQCSSAGSGQVRFRLSGGQGQGPVAGSGGYFNVSNPATTTDAAFAWQADQEIRANASSFNQNYYMSRLVSASVEFEFTGNDTSNQGRQASLYLVRNEGSPVSFQNILDGRDNYVSNIKKGIFMRYRPVDPEDYKFLSMGDNTGTCWFIIAVSGASSAAPFRFKLVCNWECVIRTDTHDLTQSPPTPTVSNPFALQAAETIMPHLPTSSGLTQMDIDTNEGDETGARSKTRTFMSRAMQTGEAVVTGYAMGGIPGAAAAGLGDIANQVVEAMGVDPAQVARIYRAGRAVAHRPRLNRTTAIRGPTRQYKRPADNYPTPRGGVKRIR